MYSRPKLEGLVLPPIPDGLGLHLTKRKEQNRKERKKAKHPLKPRGL